MWSFQGCKIPTDTLSLTMAYRGEVENLAGLSQLEGKTPKYLDPQVRPPSSGEKMGPQKEFGAFVLVSE